MAADFRSWELIMLSNLITISPLISPWSLLSTLASGFSLSLIVYYLCLPLGNVGPACALVAEDPSETQTEGVRLLFQKEGMSTCFCWTQHHVNLTTFLWDQQIQCDAEFPQCNWCKHHNLACTYNRIRKQADAWYGYDSMFYLISSAPKCRLT